MSNPLPGTATSHSKKQQEFF
jgi:hypothetical protein